MVMGGMAWSTRQGAPQNERRDRWYGVRPGDTVTMRGPGGYEEKGLVVERLHPMDNNGCTVKRPGRGGSFKAVCEWLTVTHKVEEKKRVD